MSLKDDKKPADLTTLETSDGSWMTKISFMMEQVNVGGHKIQLPPPINPSQAPLCKSFLLQSMSNTLLSNPSLNPISVAQVLGSRSCCDVI